MPLRIARWTWILLAALAASATTLPSSPTLAQEDGAEWRTTRLPGGPIYDVAVTPDDRSDAPDLQQIWAAGNDVLQSTRALTWTLPARRPLLGARSILAADIETAYVVDASGAGHMTTSEGRLWRGVQLRDEAPVHFLAAAPAFEEEEQLYAVTSQDLRLYRSSDEGNAWTEVVIDDEAGARTAAIAYSPLFQSDEIVFAGTSAGFYRSTDGGLDWSRIGDGSEPDFGADAGPLTSQGIHVPAEFGDDPRRKVDPEVSDLLAWNASGVWRSTDGGMGWEALGLPAGWQMIRDVAVSPGWPEDAVLAIAGTGSGGAVAAVSTDGGATWQTGSDARGAVGTGVAMAHDFWPIPVPDIRPPRRDPELTVFLFLPAVYRGFDFGNFTSDDPTEWGDFVPASPIPIHREVYVTTDGAGIWRTEDMGGTWNRELDTVRTVEPSAAAWLVGRSGRTDSLLIGTDDVGLYRSDDRGASWERTGLAMPIGDGQAIHQIVVSSEFDSDGTVFVAAESGVWASRDGGETYARTDGPTPARTLAVSPFYADDRTVIADGMRSTDGGQSWSPMPGADRWTWTAAAFSARYDRDRTIWAGASEEADEDSTALYVSRDDGATWNVVEERSLTSRTVTALATIAVDSSEDVRVFVGTTRGAFLSEDDGESFDRISESGSRNVVALRASVLEQPFRTGIVSVATESGVFLSTNRGIDFEEVDDAPDARNQRDLAMLPDGSALVTTVPLHVAVRELPAPTR